MSKVTLQQIHSDLTELKQEVRSLRALMEEELEPADDVVQEVRESRLRPQLERVQENVARHMEGVVGVDFSKIRVGDYRLFVDSDRKEDILVIRALRHRRHAYKP